MIFASVPFIPDKKNDLKPRGRDEGDDVEDTACWGRRVTASAGTVVWSGLFVSAISLKAARMAAATAASLYLHVSPRITNTL